MTSNPSSQAGKYGSINVREYPHEQIEGENSEVLPAQQGRKVSSFLPGLVAAVTLLLAIHFAFHQMSPDEQARIIPVLGAEQRLPENTPRFFDQAVDHYDDSNHDTWSHRYYAQEKYFKGPGHPIFLVIGGEGPNDRGMFYPFIEEHLASTFGAFVLHPEHRFYGPYYPVDSPTIEQLNKLLTPQQAMEDQLAIAQSYRKQLGCSMDRSSKDYCPLITVGGSYPAFLSTIMRLIYPDFIDIAYASSAPLLLYAQESDQFGYYDIVTKSAERASPGCAQAVRTTLATVDEAIQLSPDMHEMAIKHINICDGSVPEYITTRDMLSKELMQITADRFADMNMFNYPPTNTTQLAQTCQIFQDESMDSFEKLAKFWKTLEFNVDPNQSCFDMKSQLPDGPHATISGSDWSGLGPGPVGEMWDYQCCTTLTPAIGFSKESMFPYRKWTLEWLTQHCVDRFNIVPRPYELVNLWKFNDLVGQGATRILFTNGFNDIWSAGSYLESLSDSIVAINMPNGAHHSELSHVNAENVDTDDVKQAHTEITELFAKWLDEIKSEK